MNLSPSAYVLLMGLEILFKKTAGPTASSTGCRTRGLLDYYLKTQGARFYPRIPLVLVLKRIFLDVNALPEGVRLNPHQF